MNTRLSVNINEETAVVLRTSAARRQSTVTEQVRRAVSIYKFLMDAQRDGQRIEVVAADGAVTWVELL